MSNHTKGKWEIVADPNWIGRYSFEGDNLPEPHEDEANALLIKKSPQMYELLEEIYTFRKIMSTASLEGCSIDELISLIGDLMVKLDKIPHLLTEIEGNNE